MPKRPQRSKPSPTSSVSASPDPSPELCFTQLLRAEERKQDGLPPEPMSESEQEIRRQIEAFKQSKLSPSGSSDTK